MPAILPIEDRVEWMTSKENVPVAEKFSRSTVSKRLNAAPENALNNFVYFVKSESAGYAPVYNLTVADQHEYYANGILVSNCHAEVYSLVASLCKIGLGWTEGASA